MKIWNWSRDILGHPYELLVLSLDALTLSCHQGLLGTMERRTGSYVVLFVWYCSWSGESIDT